MAFKDYLPNCLRVHQVRPDHPLEWQDDSGNKKVTLDSLIDENCQEFSDNASAYLNPMLLNGHMQTAYAAFKPFETVDRVFYKRLILTYRDQGEGSVDIAVKSLEKSDYIPRNQSKFKLPSNYSFFEANDPRLYSNDDKPMVIILHGLTGGSAESYARTLVNRITAGYNFEACVFNARGCCNSCLTTPQMYNGGWTNDIRQCVNDLKSRFPNRKFYMVGFSLGASIMSNYIGEQGDKSEIECAVALGNPWDLCHSSYYINNTRMGSHFYSPALAKNLVDLAQKHIDVLKESPTLGQAYKEHIIRAPKTVEEFDNLFTAPMFGYNTATEYYRNASSCNRLLSIRTPFLAINAIDDPIVGFESLPEYEVKANPYVLMLKTTKGGHVAWFSDKHGKRWYTDPLCRFLSAFHKEVVLRSLKPKINEKLLPTNIVGPVMTTTYGDYYV